jgi:hypothetical protein
MLTYTSDPAEAAAVADRLGHKMVDTTPGVPYPGEWVLLKQKSSVKVAAYAVTNCTDAEVLTKIGSTTKHLTVLGALLGSTELSETAKDVISKRLAVLSSKDPAVPKISIAQHFTELTTRIVNQHNECMLDLAGARLEPSPQTVDDVLRTLVKQGKFWAVSSYISSKAGSGNPRTFWLTGSLGLTQALDLLPQSSHKAVLEEVLDKLFSDNYYDYESISDPQRVIDEELLTRIINKVSPRFVSHLEFIDNSPGIAFSDAAVTLLLKTEKWRPLLGAQVLSDEQLKQLIAVTPSDERVKLLRYVRESRSGLKMVLASLPSGTKLTEEVALYDSLDSLTSTRDPLLAQLVSLATPEMLLGYIVGDWGVSCSTALPSIKQLPVLGQRVAQLPLGILLSRLGDISTYNHSLSYLRGLVNFIPGAYYELLDREPVAEYIYHKLHATGASSDLIVDQLRTAQHTTLTTLCEVLCAIGRLSTK